MADQKQNLNEIKGNTTNGKGTLIEKAMPQASVPQQLKPVQATPQEKPKADTTKTTNKK